MPAIPPTAVRIMDEKEMKLDPQSIGIDPPIVEPIIMKSQTIDFVLMLLLYQKKIENTQKKAASSWAAYEQNSDWLLTYPDFPTPVPAPHVRFREAGETPHRFL